ncbi:hypothetical protein LOZ54_001223 [Ophidiomyces ophidiicola]|nr:hypothetical protein LOZ54_001223 [Ophidiomyces ophidiicola]
MSDQKVPPGNSPASDRVEIETVVEGDEKATAKEQKRDYAGAVEKTDPEEIRLVRKLDYRIMPTLFAMYFLNYVDRNTLAQARLNGVEKELGMHGSQFNTAISILFVGYILTQVPMLAWYHQHSLPVTPLNPRSPEIKLPSKTYATVKSPSELSSPAQTSLSIVTPPKVTREILKEAQALDIPAVWLQPGTFDDEILEYAKQHFQAAIGGDGGNGDEGWCVLVDGEDGLQAAGVDWTLQKL